MRLSQMFGKGTLGAKGEEKMSTHRSAFLCGMNMGLEVLDLHDHVVFIGKGLYTGGPMGTQSHVHKKYAEEKTDHEGKRQVLREPGERGEDMRMDQKIVSCAEQRPEEREQRADQSLDIPPTVAVIPESDLRTFESRIFAPLSNKRPPMYSISVMLTAMPRNRSTRP